MVTPVFAQISKFRYPSVRHGALSIPATVRYPLPPTDPVLLAPLFSYSYELLFPQPLYTFTFIRIAGCVGRKPSILLRTTCKSPVCYHIPVTPAVSCNYALFCATARRYPSCCQWLPHSFYRHGGMARKPSRRQTFRPPTCQLFCLQKLGASLSSLCTFFCIRFLCFQSFAASLPKTSRVGGIDPSSQRQRGIKR
jgi:hypothetical protein